MDLELVTEPTDTGLDIVPLAEMKKHVRIKSAALDDVITSCIKEAAATLHGRGGQLNRTVFPCTWRRYLRKFPVGKIIALPYPPLTGVTSVAYMDGESPMPVLSASKYIVRTHNLVGDIELLADEEWPTPIDHPRAVQITYTAGYSTYPEELKTAVKLLAAHYLQNPEATIADRAASMVSRRVEFGLDYLFGGLKVPVSYDDWL